MRRIRRLLRLHTDLVEDIDSELAFHLDMRTEQLRRQGMSAEEARAEALRQFGDVEEAARYCRDMDYHRQRERRRSEWLGDILLDLRFALRILRRNPGFTVAAVLTFALGIGAATAIFSVVQGVLLRPLPYAAPDRLVVLWERDIARNKDQNVVSVANFEAWRARSQSFDGMAALVPAPVTLADPAHPEHLVGMQVSPGYFRMLGVSPALGREFTEREAIEGGENVVMLSDGFWRRRFGADPAVLGRTLPLDDKPYTIVGVMRADFEPPRFGWIGQQDIWLPFGANESNRAWGRFLHVIARLRPDVPLSVARAEMEAIASQLALEMPSDEGWSATISGLAEQITGEVRTPLFVMLGAVALLLLIAVTNVANLSLALTRRRVHELAVRRAIGATAMRLARQLFTQSAVLGAVGCLVGLLVSVGGVRLLLLLLPADIPRAASIRLDASVLLAAMGASAIATVIFGSIAATRGLHADRTETPLLGEASHASAASRVGGRSLITTEIALALVLSVLAGLMVRSVASLRAVHLGFAADRVVIGRVALDGGKYQTAEQQHAFFSELLDRVRRTPGVQSASIVNVRPFRAGMPATWVADPAHPLARGTEPPVADILFADSALFRTLRIPLVEGDVFDGRDTRDRPARVVINQTMAHVLWPGQRAVGRQVDVGLFGGVLAEVIGVVGDVRLVDVRTPARPTAYLAASRFPSRIEDVVIRGDGDDDALARAIRRSVAAVDPALPVYDVAPLQGMVDTSLARDRFTMFLLSAFAVVAVMLAAVGIYGVFSADVTRRRREIGIRLALGARASGVLALVLRRAMTWAVLGVGIGTGAALVLTRAIASLLYGVSATDPVSFIVVVALLVGVACIATVIPAYRAARVSPMEAIRTE